MGRNSSGLRGGNSSSTKTSSRVVSEAEFYNAIRNNANGWDSREEKGNGIVFTDKKTGGEIGRATYRTVGNPNNYPSYRREFTLK